MKIRIDLLFLGYKNCIIEKNDISVFCTRLLSKGINCRIDSNGSFIIPLYREKVFLRLLSGLSYTISEAKGIPGIILNNRKRYGIFAAIIFVSILIIASSCFVWDIRIEGESTLPYSDIIKALDNADFKIGSIWGNKSTSEIEAHVLKESNNIAWININRRGTVAYISYQEKKLPNSFENTVEFSNIVAREDCVIQEITVYSGTPMVSAGETVKKGQILISGVLPPELGGGVVCASGTVLGRVEMTSTVEQTRLSLERVYENEYLARYSLSILGKNINILKKDRNFHNNYDIINIEKRLSIFEKYKLPIKTVEIIYAPYSYRLVERDDSELCEIARVSLETLRIQQTENMELLKITTGGEFTDTGYKMWSRMLLLADIGEVEKINT